MFKPRRIRIADRLAILYMSAPWHLPEQEARVVAYRQASAYKR
jgi:hypothetical protein